MWFRIIYILFVISSLTLGSVYVGPLSMRHIFSLVMLFMCVKEERALWIDRSFRIFIVFFLCFAVSSFSYGYIEDFLKISVAYYAVAFIGLWATVIMCERYWSLSPIHTIIWLGVIDGIITILQAYSNPVAIVIGNYFCPEEVEMMTEKIISGEFASWSIMGVFGAVYNGYFLLVASILALFYVISYKSVFRLFPYVVCFVASFVCQQRFPFIINVCFLVYFLYKYLGLLSYGKKILLIVSIVAMVAYVLPMFVRFSMQNDMRYSTIGMEDTGRLIIYEEAKTYVSSHLLTANIFDFRAIYGASPHMLFYNMLIYSGIIGFVFLCSIVFIHIKKSIFALFNRLCYSNAAQFCFAGALLAFTCNSLTHNASFVSGDILYWMLWGGVLASNAMMTGVERSNISNK